MLLTGKHLGFLTGKPGPWGTPGRWYIPAGGLRHLLVLSPCPPNLLMGMNCFKLPNVHITSLDHRTSDLGKHRREGTC